MNDDANEAESWLIENVNSLGAPRRPNAGRCEADRTGQGGVVYSTVSLLYGQFTHDVREVKMTF